jgi:putative ABC transport system substrate-binding protein
MKRREFISLVGGTAAWPLAARAQQQRAIPRIGLVSIGADPSNPVIFLPFLQQLRELGYTEGQNVLFEKRFAAGHAGLISSFMPIWWIGMSTLSSRPGSGKARPQNKRPHRSRL